MKVDGSTERESKNTTYIFECASKEPLMWRAWIVLALDSGCRRGEIVGLKWDDIDFKTGQLTISRNAQYTAGRGIYLTTPQNRQSRAFPLND